jgi:flagellar M-ring protein FliF
LRNWRSLSRDNKSILTIALLAAIVAGTIVVILWTSSKNYVPLYGKQELYDTANIMEMLEKEQVPFRLEKSSGQILVPENQLAHVRMALAARGVRAAMPAGLEGLDNVTGLGTSEFMEGARYRHALEGELARTIISLDAVRVQLREAVAASRSKKQGKKSAANAAAVNLGPDAQVRFINLKAWRAEVAKQHNLPAYVIFHDATLAAIAQKLPELPAGSRVLGFAYDTGERYLSVPGFLPTE